MLENIGSIAQARVLMKETRSVKLDQRMEGLEDLRGVCHASGGRRRKCSGLM